MDKKIKKLIERAKRQNIAFNTPKKMRFSRRLSSLIMSEMGKIGGKIGGKRSLETMTPEQRRMRAIMAVQAREAKKLEDEIRELPEKLRIQNLLRAANADEREGVRKERKRMANETAQCQYVDPKDHTGCDNWYPYEEGQKYCKAHRNGAKLPNIQDEIRERMNKKVESCESFSDQELSDHIKELELQVRNLQTDIRACNWLKRERESKLTDEERANLRQKTKGYKGHDPKISKLTGRPVGAPRPKKGDFIQNNLGMSMAEFVAMSDEEQEDRIAKFKEARRIAKNQENS